MVVWPFRCLTAAVLMAIPPFGIAGWAHPITAAGVLFPGWGWWGLLAATAGLIGLVTRMWPAVAIGANILYRERMPVPGSMWQPWRPFLGQSGGAKANFFENPAASVADSRIAPLICYEQLIVWPVLQSMLYDPDVVLAVGNGWWTEGTSIVAIQQASTVAWARLFTKTLVLSFNT